MRLTIELKLDGGEPIPSSEIERQGRNDAHSPKTPDTRMATLRHVLEASASFAQRRAEELSATAIKDPAAPFNDPEKKFGTVKMSYSIAE